MPYKDKNVQRQYARQWIANRRSDWFFDKTCTKCGSTQNLELDHIDPSVKVSHRIWSWSDKRRYEELQKCQPLCHDCHEEKTSASKSTDIIHGSRSGYIKEIRRDLTPCNECRKANNQYQAQYKISRKVC
jgi:hypothetical protein